ncbi:MAG TPA: ABC transporter permease [Cyclobacteriaceae bacterium]|nr:ABC transporter permease [Cyclobacteriaceae bacterium]
MTKELTNTKPFFERVKAKPAPNGNDPHDKATHPFWVIVHKEIRDHVRSWRFKILIILIALTCMGSLYTALSELPKALKPDDPEGSFFFLKLFTLSDGTLPSFTLFISLLGPLLGISLGFDAINTEQNRGTLSRLMAQPIHRDYVLNAKFTAALIVISFMLFTLGFLVMGLGLIRIGIPPTAEEFWRFIFFILISIFYVGFWLNLSILFSVQFRQPATAALAGIAVWLFFTIFYQLIVNMIAKLSAPTITASPEQIQRYQYFILNLLRIVPSQLFSDATSTLLMPSVRSLGPLSVEQLYGTVPSPLPLGQSLILVWPQLTGLIGATILCFALSYRSFMCREIRSR